MKNAAAAQFVIAILVLVGAGALYAFWFTQTQHLGEEVATVSSAIVLKSAEQAEAAETKNTLSALEADEARIAARFVKTDSIVEFLETIETAGAEFGADVAVVSVGDPVDGRVTLSLSIIGSFDAVMKTLGRIEYGPYASATKSLTLDVAEDGLWSAALTFSVMTDTSP